MQRAYLFLIATTLLWSGNFVVGRATHTSIGPLTLSTGRWLLVVILLSPWIYTALFKKKLTAQQWLRMSIMAVIGVSCYNTLIYIGLLYTPAPNGVLYNSTIPFFIIAINWFIFKKSIKAGEFTGILLSLIGVSVLISQGNLQAITGLEFSQGDVWILTAAMLWGFYTCLLPHWRPEHLSGIEFLSVLSLIGCLPILMARLLNPFDEAALEFTPQTIIAINYVAIAASILAWLFYNEAVKLIGPEKAGQSIHLMPVFVAILAYGFLNETLHQYHFIGAGFILLGLIVANKLSLFKPDTIRHIS